LFLMAAIYINPRSCRRLDLAITALAEDRY
jgi:hypothetical protein